MDNQDQSEYPHDPHRLRAGPFRGTERSRHNTPAGRGGLLRVPVAQSFPAFLPSSPQTLPGTSWGPDPSLSRGSAVSPAGPRSPARSPAAAAALQVLGRRWKAAPPAHFLAWPDPGLLAAPRAVPEGPKMTASSWENRQRDTSAPGLGHSFIFSLEDSCTLKVN